MDTPMGHPTRDDSMATDSNKPEEGDEVPHKEFYEMAGGTIPFDLTTSGTEIRCSRCDESSEEDEFDWVDSSVYIESVGDDGTVLNHNIVRIVLQCPRCDEKFSAR